MSLYNMMFGVNPFSPELLALLGLTPEAVGRFRDVHLEKDPETDEMYIIVYTRNGGGNRDEYGYVFDALAEHPLYVENWDDDFDCTYAYIKFKVPQHAQSLVRAMHEEAPMAKTPREKWDNLLGKMQAGDMDDPDVKDAVRKTAPLIEKLKAALDGPQMDGPTVIDI